MTTTTGPTGTPSDVMRRRYGLDRNPWPRRVVVGVVVAVYVCAAGLTAALLVGGAGIEARTLTWRAGPQAVSVDVELRGSHDGPIDCVIKAQDASSTDIGYRTITFASSPRTETVEVPTLFAASSVAVLGCAPQGEDMRVAPPDFPPGVAIP